MRVARRRCEPAALAVEQGVHQRIGLGPLCLCGGVADLLQAIALQAVFARGVLAGRFCGFCQVIEVIIYVLPMPRLTANADPFPENTPDFFTVGSGMCGPGTGLVCARPEEPIIRRNDLEKFKETPQVSHEESMARLAK